MDTKDTKEEDTVDTKDTEVTKDILLSNQIRREGELIAESELPDKSGENNPIETMAENMVVDKIVQLYPEEIKKYQNKCQDGTGDLAKDEQECEQITAQTNTNEKEVKENFDGEVFSEEGFHVEDLQKPSTVWVREQREQSKWSSPLGLLAERVYGGKEEIKEQEVEQRKEKEVDGGIGKNQRRQQISWQQIIRAFSAIRNLEKIMRYETLDT